MAGEAKSSAFMLATASVCIGPTNKLFEMVPATHGIGLVKNVRVTADVGYAELTQGVKQNIVYSVQNKNDVKVAFESFEYSGQNLTYALGLDGSLVVAQTDLTLKTSITTGGTAIVANATVDPAFSAGNWVIIQDQAGLQDKVHLGKLASGGTFSTNQVTLTLTAGTAMPASMTFTGTAASVANAARVSRVNVAPVGAQLSQPFFAAKIIGVLPDGGKPIVLMYPKVRITKGFDINFASDNYGNMPWELTPYQLVSGDDNYAEYAGRTGDVATMF